MSFQDSIHTTSTIHPLMWPLTASMVAQGTKSQAINAWNTACLLASPSSTVASFYKMHQVTQLMFLKVNLKK